MPEQDTLVDRLYRWRSRFAKANAVAGAVEGVSRAGAVVSDLAVWPDEMHRGTRDVRGMVVAWLNDGEEGSEEAGGVDPRDPLVECAECDGTGACAECDGAGDCMTYQDTGLCYECEGDGDCTACGGSGWLAVRRA